MRTFFFFAIFTVLLLLSFVFYIPLLLLKFLKRDNLFNQLLLNRVNFWGKLTIGTTGAKVTVIGENNIPDKNGFCLVGNHQSNMDIPLMLGYCKALTGFLAKSELNKFLILRRWMHLINCVFVERNNIRGSIKAAMDTVQKIKDGKNMILFPEGTRSKSNNMNRFKEGGLKLIIKENITIVPFTINGSYLLYEGHKKVRKDNVTITFHEPIDTSKINGEDSKVFLKDLWNIINAPLVKNQ